MAAPLVLVADDDNITRSIVEMKLKSRGYRIVTAVDGDQALHLIEIERPGLAVLDAMMPGVDGFEVLRRLKGDPELAAMPVVMLTARKLEQDIVRALDTGAADYLVKPFIPEELASRIARLLPIGRV
ncbi:response regulator transcription factor [Methylobacterium iners]|uniref:Transcriptional regulatory protein AfsQ1 n=1 Tax=Methylobacterium iners TaxID=418707 RepID=A0ABQ4RT97_9HYPH|nr:response regulator [Methylobacterium iners]GJD93998.1 Transcriptional regulatory protein AfsQ1 [Methylobacterium iners]